MGSTPTGGTYAIDFSDPIDQDVRTQCALESGGRWLQCHWTAVASALSSMCTQNTTKTDARRRMFAAMVPYRWATRERRYENWIAHWSDYEKPFAHQVILVCSPSPTRVAFNYVYTKYVSQCSKLSIYVKSEISPAFKFCLHLYYAVTSVERLIKILTLYYCYGIPKWFANSQYAWLDSKNWVYSEHTHSHARLQQ